MEPFRLIIMVENASYLAQHDQETFAMIRRAGFGASDSSILLGVNPFPDGTIAKLIAQKKSPCVTEAELAIGRMVNVRKGSDLEPIIMRKFQEAFNVPEEDIQKPTAMFQIEGTVLNVNFDGVMKVSPYFEVPVECKFMSTYGAKYWNLGKQILGNKLPVHRELMELGTEVNSIYLTRRAEECGIPIYYYTQVQQQIMALNAPFGYITVLSDKDWELKTFLVMADEQVHKKLLEVAAEVWNKIRLD